MTGVASGEISSPHCLVIRLAGSSMQLDKSEKQNERDGELTKQISDQASLLDISCESGVRFGPSCSPSFLTSYLFLGFARITLEDPRNFGLSFNPLPN